MRTFQFNIARTENLFTKIQSLKDYLETIAGDEFSTSDL